MQDEIVTVGMPLVASGIIGMPSLQATHLGYSHVRP